MEHLSQQELKSLIQNTPNERHKLLFKVGFSHALRVSELINLTREDIRDGHVSCKRLKGSMETFQPYVTHPDPDLDESKELSELFGTLKKGEKLFPYTRGGVYKMMQRNGLKAGIPYFKLHPHALKHSCAMAGIKTMGIEKVRQYLGHRSLSSTGAYLRVSDAEASKAFVEALSNA